MNLEAFEQFSGRVRFRHNDAIMLTVKPSPEKDKVEVSVGRRLKDKVQLIKRVCYKLRKHLISIQRLYFVDFRDQEDKPYDLDETGEVTSEVLAAAQYAAVKENYAALMYNQSAFEATVRHRYEHKVVFFQTLQKASYTTKTKHEPVDSEAKRTLTDAIAQDLYTAEGRNIVFASAKNSREQPTTIKVLTDIERTSYTEPVLKTLETGLLLQELSKSSFESAYSDTKPDTHINPELASIVNEGDFMLSLIKAISAATKKDINALCSDGVKAGISFLAQFDIIKPLLQHAIRFGHRGSSQDIVDLVDAAGQMLPEMDESTYDKIKMLMRIVFSSKEVLRAHDVVKVLFPYRNIDMEMYVYLVALNRDQVFECKTAFQASVFAVYPQQLHRNDTRSGATFAAITSPDAFLAATGKRMEAPFGLDQWQNKRITLNRAKAIYDVYTSQLIRRGHCPLKNISKGIRAVFQVFMGAFHFTHIETENGVYCIRLDRKRNSVLNDLDDILSIGVIRMEDLATISDVKEGA